MVSSISSESTAQEPVAGVAKDAKADALPKLTAAEFRQYNSLAVKMDYFHNHFRQTWKTLSGACTANKRPQNMTIRQFLRMGQEFCQLLTMHHTIEEMHVFPRLAVRMPKFREELELLTHHKLIHEGLERLEAYIGECLAGTRELRMEEMGEVLDGFGDVLWEHLDEEVRELGAENMRKYWSLEEMNHLKF